MIGHPSAHNPFVLDGLLPPPPRLSRFNALLMSLELMPELRQVLSAS